jgi:hypothetical protein
LTMGKRLGLSSGRAFGCFGSSRRGSMTEPSFDAEHGLQHAEQTPARLANPTPGWGEQARGVTRLSSSCPWCSRPGCAGP